LCLLVSGVAAPALAARAAVAAEQLAAQHRSQRDTAAMIALEHAPELRVSGRLDELLADADRQQRDWGHAIDRAAAPAALASAAPIAAIGASVLGAVVCGVALAPTLAPTTLAILMLLPLSAFEATTALPGAGVQLARSRVAARRLHILTNPGNDDLRRPAVPSVDLEQGARLAVTGPSGSGKTTLLMNLAGLLPEEIASDAAFFAEDAHLFSTTVRDNLLVARGDAVDDELRDALDRVGLGDWLDSLPEGLATILVGGNAAVSAGQRRRLLLARALISTAPTVLLDEPTEHLDTADGSLFLTELLTPGGFFPTGRTVVVATHHLPADFACPVVKLPACE
ncbi:MAG: ATP-binding cassette domain-containing protein, partial [Mycobacterium sp.]